ncbi:MAG: mannonate dehydratase [Hyphomicrobiales bacterium]
MKQTWRWFGPSDTISIEEVEQSGATGIVTALHHIPNGDVWPSVEIEKRKDEISRRSDGTPSRLKWDVVESLAISEDIKKQDGNWRDHIAAYKQNLHNLADAGLKVICYNFMPVIDWSRTDLAHTTSTGATCLRFDIIDFAAFDIFVLKRDGAIEGFSEEIVEAARERHANMSDHDRSVLMTNITMGLPGANQKLTFDELRELLAAYDGISEQQLHRHLGDFLEEVVPVAEGLGLRMCIHPDDPPFSLLGLPRIVSTEADYARITSLVDSPANGITLCSGSMGVNPDADLPGMMTRLGSKVHFLHLRNVAREEKRFPGSFHEAPHLGGSTNMVELIDVILKEEARRKAERRMDWCIPMRPDHGEAFIDDQARKHHLGYPLMGRLRGLAELRGVVAGLGGEMH